ncbi:23224_t:CDS:2 [Rhizophagus irregularis]|nr:23224_t:CDS:2 [Rhizophagus irregularis]
MSEHYRGYNSIRSYLKLRGEDSSFNEFVNLYQEMILESPPDSAENWVGLEVAWKTRFLNAVRETIPVHHEGIREKVRLEVSNKQLMTYWQAILTEKQNSTSSTSSNLSHIQKDDLSTSVSETLNIFKKVQFPTYYNKLKEIWYDEDPSSNYYVIDFGNRDILEKVHNLLNNTELQSLFERLKLDDEEKYLNKFVAEMEKTFHSLNGVATKFRYLSNTLPLPVLEYDQSQNIDIHIIKSISSHIDSYSKMNGILENTTERSWTAHGRWGCRTFKRPNQIPMFLLEVSGDPSNDDIDKLANDKKKLIKEGVFALNKFMTKTRLPSWEVCKDLKIFLAQGYSDKLEIGQIIYIGPKLYLFAPFTVPSIIIPTSTANLSYTSRLIRTLLCLRFNIIKKIREYKEFEIKAQQLTMNPGNKYVTGASPGRTKTVVFEEFLPKISRDDTRDDTKRKRGRPRGRGKRKTNE